MPRSATTRHIAVLTDRGSLSGSIVWIPESIAAARELLANVGAWQSSPDGGGDILLGDSAFIDIFDDYPPWHSDDNLETRIEDTTPRLTFSVGPRGGIRREVY